jgi:hypothetical protein
MLTIMAMLWQRITLAGKMPRVNTLRRKSGSPINTYERRLIPERIATFDIALPDVMLPCNDTIREIPLDEHLWLLRCVLSQAAPFFSCLAVSSARRSAMVSEVPAGSLARFGECKSGARQRSPLIRNAYIRPRPC